MALTYGELYFETNLKIKEMGIDNPDLDAREMICAAAGKTKEEFLRDRSLYTGENIEEQVQWMLSLRQKGEPLAYIIGEWDFCGITLEINPMVLIPRTDTEVLAQKAIEYAIVGGEESRVLDMCTGSGCIGIACAALIQKRRGKKLRAGVAVLIAVIAFVVCNLLMVLLSQRPALL